MEAWKLSRFLAILNEKGSQHANPNKFSFIGECGHIYTFDVTRPIKRGIFNRMPQELKNVVINHKLEIEDK